MQPCFRCRSPRKAKAEQPCRAHQTLWFDARFLQSDAETLTCLTSTWRHVVSCFPVCPPWCMLRHESNLPTFSRHVFPTRPPSPRSPGRSVRCRWEWRKSPGSPWPWLPRGLKMFELPKLPKTCSRFNTNFGDLLSTPSLHSDLRWPSATAPLDLPHIMKGQS